MKDCGEVAIKEGIQQNRIDTLQLWWFPEMPTDGILVEMLTEPFSDSCSRSHLHYW